MLNKYTAGVRWRRWGGGERSDTEKVFSGLSHTLRCLDGTPVLAGTPGGNAFNLHPISKLKPQITPFVSPRLPRRKENQPVQTGHRNDTGDCKALSKQPLRLSRHSPLRQQHQTQHPHPPKLTREFWETKPMLSIARPCRPRGQDHSSSDSFPRQNPGEELPDPMRSPRMPLQAWAGLTKENIKLVTGEQERTPVAKEEPSSPPSSQSQK